MESTSFHVVVVNDDPVQLEILATTVGRRATHVEMFRSAVSAVEYIRRQDDIDLVVTDLYMPEMDGWRFCRLLRSGIVPEGADVPILIVSATFAGADARRITHALGANGFLAVPYQAGDLWAAVDRVTSGRADYHRPTILIVEDDAGLVHILQRALAIGGFAVTVATTVSEAESCLQRDRFDAVLLDYSLPDATSDALLTDIRERRPETAVVMMTSDPTPEIATHLMRLGAEAFARKPIDPPFISELLEHAIRQRELLHVEEILEKRTTQLRMSEARYRRIFDNIRDVYFELGADGTLHAISPSALDVVGRTWEEVLSKGLASIFEDPAQFGALIRTVREVGSVDDHEVMLSHSDGSTIFGSVSAKLIANGATRIVGSLRDITARKAAQVELKRANDALSEAAEKATQLAEEAEAASKAKSAFLAAMSHDIRTPLSAIVSAARLLAEACPSDEATGYRQVLQTSADHLRSLVNDILDYSRMESGRIEMNRARFDAGEIVDDVIRLYALQASEKGIDLRSFREPEIPELVGDPARLAQVLSNLVGNAVKFTDNGRVLVSLSTSPVGPDGVELTIMVEDSGPGIDADELQNLFEPFVQANRGIRGDNGGSGLGLAIVKRLADLMNGEITVDSAPGEGSRFAVTIPFERSPYKVPSSQSEPSVPSHSSASRARSTTGEAVDCARVLIVDDSESNLWLLARTAEKLGYVVHRAETGGEALRILAESSVDLALVDINLPDTIGYDVARRSIDGPTPKTRYVAMSADAGVAEELRAVAAGMEGCVRKPIERGILEDIVSGRWRSSGTGPLGGSAISWEDICRRMDDDPQLAREVVGIVRRELPNRLVHLAEAAQRGDLDAVRRFAHAIKGSVRNLTDGPVVRHAFDLEHEASSADPTDQDALASIRSGTVSVIQATQGFLHDIQTILPRDD